MLLKQITRNAAIRELRKGGLLTAANQSDTMLGIMPDEIDVNIVMSNKKTAVGYILARKLSIAEANMIHKGSGIYPK